MLTKRLIQILGAVALIVAALPFIATDNWWIRIFDFPHTLLTILTLLVLVTYGLGYGLHGRKDYLFAGLLLAALAVQLVKIFPYTPLGRYTILNSARTDSTRVISIYLANVLQENENKTALGAAITSYGADLLLFVETDRAWQEGIAAAVRPHYPYAVEMPLSNTYGMLLYSKLPLIEPAVRFIVDDSIPSIHTLVRLPSGDTVQLYAIHPTPPMPQHNSRSTDRDAEMMKIALASKDAPYPVIVLGDFNDVAWSASTAHFLEVSGLLDPRQGRGFYNTYHEKYFLFRWPLDHLFVSEEFRVREIRRGTSIDSDHFPLFFRLSYEPERGAVQDQPPPSRKDIERAHEQIEAEREQDRKE